MRNPFKFFIRDPSRIISIIFTIHIRAPRFSLFLRCFLYSYAVFFILTFFIYPFSRIFLLFPLPSTFSSHSTILSPFRGFPYPFSLLSRPHRFIIFRYTHPLLPPFKVFRLLPNTFHSDFSYDPSKLYFNQPDYDRSIDPVQL